MKIPSNAAAFLWHYIKQYIFPFLTMVICLFVWAANESLFPYFIKLMVDLVADASVDHSIWHTFSYPVTGIFTVWIGMEISMRLFGIVEVYVYPKFRAQMRGEIFDYVKAQSSKYFINNLSGSVGSKISDIPKSSQYIMEHMLWHVIAIIFVFVLSIAVLAQVSWVFSSLVIVWALAHMGVTIYFQKEINSKVSEHYESIAELNGETVDIINNSASMRLFSRIKFETQRLEKYQKSEIQKSIASALCLFKIDIIRGLMSLIFIFAIVYFLLVGWKEGWLSPGDFPLVAMSSFNLMGQLGHMSKSLVDMFRDIGTLNGALSLLKIPHSVTDAPHALPLDVKQGSIEFRDINFGYQAENPLFKGLSLKIHAGEKIGLVGFSGSGKTTFMNLVLREYDLISGQILLDQQNIADVTQESLRRQISVIPQEPGLFHRSVMENIRYGNLDANDHEVIQAAKKAHCDEFIMKLSEGYHTVIGERGLKLSGGQRQRLVIARAILKNAPILFLDEATSALDSATEKVIHESLIALMEHRTTIVIAHRLSTLKMMDRIIVFDKGKIVEEGTQRQLLKKNGYFAHLWSLQLEGFLPDKDQV